MTPLELRVSLHYHYLQEDFPITGPAVQDALKMLLDKGFLTEVRTVDLGMRLRYEGTHKNAVFVAALCSVPEPVSHWVVDMSKV